jgi:hypothetical protein
MAPGFFAPIGRVGHCGDLGNPRDVLRMFTPAAPRVIPRPAFAHWNALRRSWRRRPHTRIRFGSSISFAAAPSRLAHAELLFWLCAEPDLLLAFVPPRTCSQG